MTTETTYPVCILEAGEDYVEPIATLDQQAATLAEAKALAVAAGYHVIDEGEGGCCALHAPDGETPEWAITVTPAT